MSKRLTKEQYLESARMVDSWRRPLLVSHVRPDGDAVGSLVALSKLFVRRGATPVALIYDDLPHRYRFLARGGELRLLHREVSESNLDSCDSVLVLDTCSLAQIEPIAEWLIRCRKPKLAVDHHVTRDAPMDHYLIDESAAATCLMLYEWAQAAGWGMDAAIAEALFTGLATDTGWFRYSNTDARALRAAAELDRHGVPLCRLYELLYQQDTPAKVKLQAAALGSLELHEQERAALMSLTPSAFRHAGAEASDTEDIVNEPLRIGSVIVSALLVEKEEGRVRVSFRSKAPATADQPDVDVALLAAPLGGGGHKRAAGATIHASLPEARVRVLQAVGEALQCSGASSC